MNDTTFEYIKTFFQVVYVKIRNFPSWSTILWRIKDYNRLQYDYGCVLCHATDGRMSKTCYDRYVIYDEIDDAQEQHYSQYFKDDMLEMIENGATMEEIVKYLKE